MDEMANELKTLRTKVMQPGAGGQEGGAANAPLTMTEKKTLVKDVQKLIAVPELLSEVIRILSESGVDTSAEVIWVDLSYLLHILSTHLHTLTLLTRQPSQHT